ncbi:MAG TPA: hypothetical protein PLA97_00460 [Rubrivivax sp.]|nr:hypothetical protein [Rubrivivax sp.]
MISLNDNATLPAVISSAQLEVGAPSQVRLNALWLAPRSLNRTGESLMTRNTLHAMARVLTGWLIGLSAVFAAPILQVDSNGRLLGALGVEIQGRTYNVSFQDGNCGAAVAIFVTCPPLGWLGERQRALDASQALLDQVFVGIYDDQPMRVAGCSDTELCMVLTPWYEELNDPFNPANGLIVSSAYAYNYGLSGEPDFIGIGYDNVAYDTATDARKVYAVWTFAAPEPGSLPSAASALLLLMLVMRRRTAG